MGKEAEKANGIFVTTAGADEITGSDCNAATFRWSVPTFGAIEQTVRPLIDSMPKAKRWYTITPQYVFGDGLLSAAKNIFKEKGIEHVGNSYHSLAEKEFSGYITNAIAAKPDVLLLLNFGAQCADTLRQAVSFGMHKNMTILVAWASGLEQFESLGADLCDGIYFGAQYWQGELDRPEGGDRRAGGPQVPRVDGRGGGSQGRPPGAQGLLPAQGQGQVEDEEQGRLRGRAQLGQVVLADRPDGLQARLSPCRRAGLAGGAALGSVACGLWHPSISDALPPHPGLPAVFCPNTV